MFNPFAPLTPLLLQAFVNAGEKYFVRQAFSRAQDQFDEGIKGYFMLTHYTEAGHAQHHMSAIGHDPYRFLYDWSKPDHQSKLSIAASSPPGYKVYSALFVNDRKKHVTGSLRQKAKYYIDFKLKWKPSRSQKIVLDIYVNYGQLYARLALKAQEVRVKLEEIENLKNNQCNTF